MNFKEKKGFLTVYAIISMLMIIIILGVISFNVHSRYMAILKLQTAKKEKKVENSIELKKVYISDINEFDRMFNTNQEIANSASVSRYNELKQGQNNIFYSARMGGNIKLMVDEEANAFGRVYVLEFATESKLNEIRAMYAQFIQNDYPFVMFSKE